MTVVEIVAITYLALINLAAFTLFGVDKARAAKGHRRIPEIRLMLTALLGGFLGGYLGMQAFRHKTRKLSFLAVYTLASLFSGAALFYLWWS
jgi:uncharacterized membrane protein YsdA (DUF1294 family)